MDESAREPRWVVPAALVVTCAIGALVRIELLDQPMRYDEAVTYRLYVHPAAGPMDILRDYSANNHLLHTLLVWASVRMFGNIEWAIRLPALIAGLAIVPMTYVVIRNAAGRTAGVIAAALVAASPALVFYSTNGRGYTMVALFTLIALAAAQRALARDSSLGWAAIVIAIALGSWTIPVMAFPAAAIFAWMALEAAAGGASMGGRPFVVRFILCLLATAAMTLALYAPTLLSNALWELTGNRWVKSLGVTRFLNDLRNLPIEVARSWMP